MTPMTKCILYAYISSIFILFGVDAQPTSPNIDFNICGHVRLEYAWDGKNMTMIEPVDVCIKTTVMDHGDTGSRMGDCSDNTIKFYDSEDCSGPISAILPEHWDIYRLLVPHAVDLSLINCEQDDVCDCPTTPPADCFGDCCFISTDSGSSDDFSASYESSDESQETPLCHPDFRFSAGIFVMNQFTVPCQDVTLPNCDEVEFQVVNSMNLDHLNDANWCCSDTNCGSGSSQRRLLTTNDPLTVRFTSNHPEHAVDADFAKAICEAMGSLSADQCAVTTIVREENDDGAWTWTTTERDGNGEITSGPLVQIRDSNGNLIEEESNGDIIEDAADDEEESSSSSSGIDDDLWLILFIILGLLALLLCALVLFQIHKYCERRLECRDPCSWSSDITSFSDHSDAMSSNSESLCSESLCTRSTSSGGTGLSGSDSIFWAL